MKTRKIELLSKLLLYSIMFYIVKLLVCNIQNVLLVDSNLFRRFGLLIYDFFILRFRFIDDGVVTSESEKYI